MAWHQITFKQKNMKHSLGTVQKKSFPIVFKDKKVKGDKNIFKTSLDIANLKRMKEFIDLT